MAVTLFIRFTHIDEFYGEYLMQSNKESFDKHFFFLLNTNSKRISEIALNSKNLASIIIFLKPPLRVFNAH